MSFFVFFGNRFDEKVGVVDEELVVDGEIGFFVRVSVV